MCKYKITKVKNIGILSIGNNAIQKTMEQHLKYLKMKKKIVNQEFYAQK